jgi:hypothetical protein
MFGRAAGSLPGRLSQAANSGSPWHSLPPSLQDSDKLEPGGFYLDRQPRGKHLPLAGTGYSPSQVDQLWAKLEDMAAPALE